MLEELLQPGCRFRAEGPDGTIAALVVQHGAWSFTVANAAGRWHGTVVGAAPWDGAELWLWPVGTEDLQRCRAQESDGSLWFEGALRVRADSGDLLLELSSGCGFEAVRLALEDSTADPIVLDLDPSLRAAMDQGALLRRLDVTALHLCRELGFVVPDIRLRQDSGLEAGQFAVSIRGRCVSMAAVPNAKVLQSAPYDEVDVLATAVTEVIRTHAGELLYTCLSELLEQANSTDAVLVERAQACCTNAEIAAVLGNLLAEGVSIRDLRPILETVIDNIHMTRDPVILTECARVQMARIICNTYVERKGVIRVITMDPKAEITIAESLTKVGARRGVSLDAGFQERLLSGIGSEARKQEEQGRRPVLLCAPNIRPAVRAMLCRSLPHVAVLSWNEIAPHINVDPVGFVST